MSKRSKKGKFRPTGLMSKIKFDILPPQGDSEVTITGFAALAVAGVVAAGLLLSSPVLAPVGIALAIGVVVIYLVKLARGIK